MKRDLRVVMLLGFFPTVAFAHGEQVLLLPVGQAGALIGTLLLAFLLKMRVSWRIALIVASLVTMVFTWVAPGPSYFSVLEIFGTSGFPWFLMGLCPPLLIAGLTYGVLRFVFGAPEEKKPNP